MGTQIHGVWEQNAIESLSLKEEGVELRDKRKQTCQGDRAAPASGTLWNPEEDHSRGREVTSEASHSRT